MDYSRDIKQVKEVLHNPAIDQLLNDKLTGD
jgi:hypothetical protein